MSTLITGLILAWLNGYLADAIAIGLTDGVPKHTAIGIGMWLGTIMWFNVWFIIWPNQKKALASSKWQPTRKRKRGVPRCCSREPTMLSIPMLYAMVVSQTCSDLNSNDRRGLRAPFFCLSYDTILPRSGCRHGRSSASNTLNVRQAAPVSIHSGTIPFLSRSRECRRAHSHPRPATDKQNIDVISGIQIGKEATVMSS